MEKGIFLSEARDVILMFLYDEISFVDSTTSLDTPNTPIVLNNCRPSFQNEKFT